MSDLSVLAGENLPVEETKKPYTVDWFDCNAGIRCECGVEVILSDVGEPVVCECGIRYVLSSKLEFSRPNYG